MQKIKVLYVPVEGNAKIVEVEDSLEAKKEMIGCDTIDMRGISEDGLCVLIDDEGRFTNKKTNPHFYKVMKNIFGLGLVGDFLILRTDEEGADVDLNDEDIAKFDKVLKLENDQEVYSYQKMLAEEEDAYVRANPEVLAPKVYPMDFEEYFGIKKEETKMNDITVMIPFKITQDFVDSVCCTAYEGGINYWCNSVKVDNDDYKGGKYASEVISRGGSLTLVIDDAEDMDFEEETVTLTLDKFVKGYQQYVEWAIHHDDDVYTDAGDIDAEIADMIIQFAVFDEIVFG